MKILVTHPIHPGQFGALAEALVREGADVLFLCHTAAGAKAGYAIEHYPLLAQPTSDAHMHLRAPEQAMLHAEGTAAAARKLCQQGFVPDLVIGPAGFGQLALLRDEFPDAAILAYAEYFYRRYGADVGFDPVLAVSEDEFPRIRLKNAVTLLSLDVADAIYTPTQWQRDLFPDVYHHKMTVVHDGVDTDRLKKKAGVELTLSSGARFRRDRPLITYAARALEHYRGFHHFWPALASVLERDPDVEALVVGEVRPAYGPGQDNQHLVDEMLARYPCDLRRVHFVPSLLRDDYIKMLQVSSCHAYLSYPFVPSWSLVEAMACETPLVVSGVAPVREIVGENTCRIVDFFDIAGFADAMIETLSSAKTNALARNARKRAVAQFDFAEATWPRLRSLIRETAARRVRS